MRKRKKKYNRKKLLMIFSIMFVGILSLTIAYAALSTTLNISGSAEVNAAEWGLKIEKFDTVDFCEDYICGESYVAYGDAEVIDSGTITDNVVSGIDVSLTLPGDGVDLIYTATNIGTIPLVYSELSNLEYNVSSPVGNSQDVVWGNNNFYFDSLLAFMDEGVVEPGYVLCPGDSIILGMYFGIDTNATTLPSNKITISNLGFNVLFTQGDDNLCIDN